MPKQKGNPPAVMLKVGINNNNNTMTMKDVLVLTGPPVASEMIYLSGQNTAIMRLLYLNRLMSSMYDIRVIVFIEEPLFTLTDLHYHDKSLELCAKHPHFPHG